MQLADRRMMASVGLTIFGSGASSQRTSRGPRKTVPSMTVFLSLGYFAIAGGRASRTIPSAVLAVGQPE